MNPQEVPLIAGAQTLRIKLGAQTYVLTIVWRGMWVLDIADANGNPLVCGLALVTGADLLAPFAYLGIGGMLQVQSDGIDPDAVPTYANLGAQSHLYWTPD